VNGATLSVLVSASLCQLGQWLEETMVYKNTAMYPSGSAGLAVVAEMEGRLAGGRSCQRGGAGVFFFWFVSRFAPVYLSFCLQ